jgi:hypothetical protein
MEERGVKERINNSQVYFWEDAAQYATFPTAPTYDDIQVGDLVEFDNLGRLVRAPSGGTGITTGRYNGVVVGIAPDSGEYPAFGAHLNNPLIGLLSRKSELIMRQIDASGNYLSTPTLTAGALTKFVYNASTKRWGVQPFGGDPATGRVAQVLSDGRLLIIFGG